MTIHRNLNTTVDSFSTFFSMFAIASVLLNSLMKFSSTLAAANNGGGSPVVVPHKTVYLC